MKKKKKIDHTRYFEGEKKKKEEVVRERDRTNHAIIHEWESMKVGAE